MKKQSTPRRLAFFCVILILVLVVLIGGLRLLESTVFHGQSQLQVDRESKTITRNGVEYFPRQDITVIMLLGVDRKGPAVSSGSYKNEGRCDAAALLILDHTREECRILSLNRDTMVTMPVLGIGGKQAGTAYGQLALSHAYGDGLEESCENTRTTISNMLYGLNIDHYAALNLDGITVLNDAVGGVTVTVRDDFSQVDPNIKKGEMTLTGEQALTFVRTRWDVGNQLNVSRMERHEAYIDGFLKAFRAKAAESDTFLGQLYEQVSPYMVTDCSVNVLTGFLERCTDYPLAQIVTPKGRNIRGEEFYEFYPDEAKLDDLVLDLFYTKKR